MDPLLLCGACHCFVKRTEAACPFCGSALQTPVKRGPRRGSRAAWLAAGSSLAMAGTMSLEPGCSSDAASAEGPSDGSASTAIADSSRSVVDVRVTGPDGVVDDAGPDAADVTHRMVCPVAQGSFACSWQGHYVGGMGDAEDAGSATCHPGTEYCARALSSTYCGIQKYDFASCQPRTADGGFPVECRDCPTCECVRQYLPKRDQPNTYQVTEYDCVDVDGGGVEIRKRFSSCGPCYGAPPARRGRLRANA
jgi:hypothetical protein